VRGSSGVHQWKGRGKGSVKKKSEKAITTNDRVYFWVCAGEQGQEKGF
jgi:hypothetical protein